MITVITQDNFQAEVLESEKPVLVDFWASWCGPCRMVAPIVAQIDEEQEGVIKVGKVNVDDEGELASRFGIMSIPTLLLFKDGKVADQSVGVKTKDFLVEMCTK